MRGCGDHFVVTFFNLSEYFNWLERVRLLCEVRPHHILAAFKSAGLSLAL